MHSFFRSWSTAAVAAVLLFALAPTLAPQAVSAQPRRDRNFDARPKHNVGFVAAPEPAQRAAEQALAREVPGLAVAFDRTGGVARKIVSHGDYLSGPRPGVPARQAALDFVQQQRELLGLSAEDLAGHEITDEVLSSVSGTTHLYLRQRFAGIPVYNGQLQVNVNRQGHILSVNNAFARDLALSVNTHRPRISAPEAVLAAAEHLDLDTGAAPTVLSTEPAGQQTTRLSHPGLSAEEITAELFWLPLHLGETRLVWNFQLRLPSGDHWFDLNVDAVSGKIWTRFDWVSAAEPEYTVYPIPVESPQHTSPLPPADARVLVLSPADLSISELGWHDDGTTAYTRAQGNNVHACPDRDANNVCDSETDCGADLHCNFPLDLTLAPITYIDAAVTNLFYWSNIIHDVQFRYGFDEPSGNFQETHFNRLGLGLGSDSVNADAQDGADASPFFNCNANFATPPDGSNPRMQMFTCDAATQDHDGDLDNGVIVHEYGHGISNRLVGGPSNVSCLGNLQRPSEGWSDWFGLVYTAETGDLSTDPRGLGSYLFNLPPDGTIRPQQYSTDPAINDYTYESISGLSVPHGVGSVWAQGLWEVFWALVGKHRFNEDLADFDIAGFATAAGNQRAMLYVTEGLKNTACSPTFVDARDGIIQAVIDFDSDDLCTVWQAFADFGLGADAEDCGPGCLTVTNGFALPVACQPDFAGPDRDICLGETVTLGQPPLPGTTYLWSTGETTAQITVTPDVTTTYTVTATDPFGTFTDSVTVTVDLECRCGLNERFEGNVSGWAATGLRHLTNSSPCAAPENGYSSPTHAFYYGQDATCNYETGFSANFGTLTSPILVGINSTSTLRFQYLREVESWLTFPYDRTEVDIVTESGSTTVFSLDSIDPSTPVWTSSGSISLAAFAGQKIRVRFRFETLDGAFNDFIGWFVDDVVVTSAKATNVNFDGGSASGWANDGAASTCTTGAYIVGTPALMVTFGTITQPGGDAGSGSGRAFYTAANTSPDIDDVDLGQCVANSPTYSVTEPSVVSIAAFHGQRTAGNDPLGDFFDLEISTDGGGSWRSLLVHGDDNVDALWTHRGLAVSGGASVKFRVTASDGAGPGDTLEGGVDELMICPLDGTVPIIKDPDPCVTAAASFVGGDGTADAIEQQPRCPLPNDPTL